MTLTQQQKALVENIIMVIDEETSKWTYHEREGLNNILRQGFWRVKIILQHERPGQLYEKATYILGIAQMVGREVRRARSYKDMTAEEIIEALDTALKILEMIE